MFDSYGNPSDQPAAQNVVLDREAWKEVTDDAGKVMGAVYDERQLRARYEAFALRLARLVAEKQVAYGDSFQHTRGVLKLLFPHGVPVERYNDLLTITRIIDKLFRVANQKDYGGENPYQDIAGYAIRAACEDEDEGVVTTLTDDQGPIDLV